MEANNSDIFAWEKQIYIQDPSTFQSSEELRTNDSFDSSFDDNKENICPSTGKISWKPRNFENRGVRVPLQDITHLFKKPREDPLHLSPLGKADKAKRMVRSMR